ncbi:WD repeat-containing protein 74 [Dissostichus eleginoides]|uniref:WD repeat-containing protein 74 n=1 Tax=Dissostichus eleginoides TaxID=100907 RepID=A0AAD9FGJ5_DISEL|nr:WD repeat-containing protein 74 [Dissostichus eleginoides]
MADSSRLCSVFLGSETGILKGAFNFCNTQHLSRDQEVRVLVWGDRAETDLLLGARDGSVKTFSLEKGSFTETGAVETRKREALLGWRSWRRGGWCSRCLHVMVFQVFQVWRESSSDPVAEVITGKNVSRMRQNPAQRNKMATGGKENGLKIWDLENPKNPPVFSAKNLKDDWLDLKRAQWVRDIAFIPQSEKVVTCTGYHQVHIHDPSSPQRRPVMEMEFGDHPLTALSLPTGGTSVVVGNTRGEVAVLDLRKGLVRGVLKGLCGGVRALQCHPSLPIVASCGLDRFLRIHSLEDRKLQHKVYLKRASPEAHWLRRGSPEAHWLRRASPEAHWLRRGEGSVDVDPPV